MRNRIFLIIVCLGLTAWISYVSYDLIRTDTSSNLRDCFSLKDESIVYCTKELLNMKSLFNLVGETFFSVNHSDFFITEKTFKNYLIKQPFVSFSKTGFNNELKNYGFKSI